MSLPIVPKGAVAEHEPQQDPRARVRAAREGLAKASTKRFVIPGYDETNTALGGARLVARYRRMLVEELDEAFGVERLNQHRGDDGKVDTVAVNAQFLADACEEITLHEPDGMVLPLVDGARITYKFDLATGESLGTFLGIEQLPSLRAQMVAAFGDNEIALNDHSKAVVDWMQSANTADEDSLGEH